MADKTGYIGRNPGDSQTDFAFSAGYTVGYLDVYLNGIRLVSPNDYSATDGSNVGLTTYAIAGDTLELVAYKAFNVGNVTNAGGNFNVGQNLTVNGTYNIGIHSAGTEIASEVKNLNFVGAGNTLQYDASTNTVDISIAGGGGGGIGTALGETAPLDVVFKTAKNFAVAAGTSVTIEVDDATCGNTAMMKPGTILVGTGATFHIAPSTILKTNVLGLFV